MFGLFLFHSIFHLNVKIKFAILDVLTGDMVFHTDPFHFFEGLIKRTALISHPHFFVVFVTSAYPLAFQKLHSRIMDLSAADLLVELERNKPFVLSRNTDSLSNVNELLSLCETSR